MLLPMPSMPTQLGPPSEYVQSRQWVVLAILVSQTAICALRLVVLLDIMGGFIMAILVGVGWYAYKESMNITFICYWGMMCLINGAFDLVKLIDHWVKAPVPLFTSSLPASYNFMSFILLAVPLVTLPGAVLSWYMYKSYTDDAGGSASGVYNYGRSSGRDESSSAGERLRLWSSSSSGGRGFQAFGGGGQRLGSSA